RRAAISFRPSSRSMVEKSMARISTFGLRAGLSGRSAADGCGADAADGFSDSGLGDRDRRSWRFSARACLAFSRPAALFWAVVCSGGGGGGIDPGGIGGIVGRDIRTP